MWLKASILKIYPNISDNDFVLQDDSDGNGPYIKSWGYGGGPKPTTQQLIDNELAGVKIIRIAAGKKNMRAKIESIESDAKEAYNKARLQALDPTGGHDAAMAEVAEIAALVAIQDVRQDGKARLVTINAAVDVAAVEAVSVEF